MKKKYSSFEKARYVLAPFFIYMFVKTFALLGGVMIFQNMPFYIEEKKSMYFAIANGIASIVGVTFLYRKFLEETTFRGEYDMDANVIKQTYMRLTTSLKTHAKSWYKFIFVIMWAAMSAVALNVFIEIIGLHSKEYDKVEAVQYSVPIWLGVILYGMIAPTVEEIVFRGMIFVRMKRHFSLPVSILISSLMFGLFHGNMLQALYGTIMGCLIALSYEWCQSFFGAILFHVSANMMIYLLSAIYPQFSCSFVNCIICTFISAILGFLCKKACEMKKK